MVTFTIIEELKEKADIYEIGKYSGNSLWLADDATIIATNEESVEKAVNALETAGGRCGLELSAEKNKILRIRGPKMGEKIGKYKIEEEAKYLGIQIEERGRDIFQVDIDNSSGQNHHSVPKLLRLFFLHYHTCSTCLHA